MLLIIIISAASYIFDEISRITGILLLGILAWYLFRNIHGSIKVIKTEQPENIKPVSQGKKIIAVNLIMFTVGLTLTLLGSTLLVTNGEKIAVALKVPEIVIGLTMTSLGTSLPELLTAITALRKKAYGISMGNILGANILNIILVLGLAATILPIPISLTVLRLHLPFVFLIVAATLSFSFMTKNYFRRRFGFMLFASYVVYILLTVKS